MTDVIQLATRIPADTDSEVRGQGFELTDHVRAWVCSQEVLERGIVSKSHKKPRKAVKSIFTNILLQVHYVIYHLV